MTEAARITLLLTPPEIALMLDRDGALPRGLSSEQRELYASWQRYTDERAPRDNQPLVREMSEWERAWAGMERQT
jgi:hypothetical protein